MPPEYIDTTNISEAGLTQAQFDAFGEGFESAIGYNNTNGAIFTELTENSRANTPPQALQPWECRIGLSKFFVPPTNIGVSKSFKAGALGAGALRAGSTPKFNSGHSETVVTMTLYFPNVESVWGMPNANFGKIDFLGDDDEVIDRFASSLRGLIAQFKYAPFLPVRNAYLNGTHNITGVAMHSMSVETVEGFPFAVRVQLNMLKFNHNVYLPMIDHFDSAIHWGRFRQYIGRAAQRLHEITNSNFLSDASSVAYEGEVETATEAIREALRRRQHNPGEVSFSPITEWENGKNFDLYYPAHDPLRVIVPENTDWEQPADITPSQKAKNWWQGLLDHVGVDVNTYPLAQYESLDRYNNYPNSSVLGNESLLLREWLDQVGVIVTAMGPGQLQEYANRRASEVLRPGASANDRENLEQNIQRAWFAIMYETVIQDPFLQRIFDYQQFRGGQTVIKEWEVPMVKLGLDPEKVVVHGVSVNIGNNLARLQVQMQEEPVHQHIGGMDTRAEVYLTVFGETELLKLRNMFDRINSMSRLEHGHGVLGFLGVKNVLTALCGMKYAVPQQYDVQTVEGYPHVYQVTMTLLDFDVFQQKREELSSEQQAELVDAFGKRNPFLRIKQHWGAFNCYPDMPLSVRDNQGKIVGQLDPDFYFRAFETVESDVVTWNEDTEQAAPVFHTLGTAGAESSKPQVVRTSGAGGVSVHDGIPDMNRSEPDSSMVWNEMVAATVVDSPFAAGLTPLSEYMNPHLDGSGDASGQYQAMMHDAQYRDKSGRMIRAFPTYMLWLIDEGGTFSGVKLFDNFYGMQSVMDMSIVQSEDIMADTLVLRLSNLYGKLSTPYREQINDTTFPNAAIINTQLNRHRNLLSGLTDYIVNIDSVNLQPGVRLHLRMGYGANPNSLETVFNGVITTVENGEIVTIIAQSDAVELSAMVNDSNQKGHSGKIDGSLMGGFWLSEPRDLMVRLLSMGSSTFKEQIAHATRGRIFSENKFGIRHFGNILYEPMTEEERNRKGVLEGSINDMMGGIMSGIASGGVVGAAVGFLSSGILDLGRTAWANFSSKRDLELYKRNIYPGNGLGVAQYMGGDIGDGGLYTAMFGTGISETGEVDAEANPLYIQQDIEQIEDYEKLPYRRGQSHPFLSAMGITHKTDDDLKGFNEVSFRAQTYMKSVWDLFQVCAALLPNYIVAVRPFEDRSTVFYGKPHWLYTSGVIPLSKGIPPDKEPATVLPDEEMAEIMRQVQEQVGARQEENMSFYDKVMDFNSAYDPYNNTGGTVWEGGDINNLPLTHDNGAILPARTGKMVMEMHLPTSGDLNVDIRQHLQHDGVRNNPAAAHPGYMDRVNGGRGGEPNYDPFKEDQSLPGEVGAFGYLDPVEEQYYCNMRWHYNGDNGGRKISGQTRDMLRGRRVLVFNKNTQKACICAPGEWGPHGDTGVHLGVSPDAAHVLGAQTRHEFIAGWVDDSYRPGPIDVSNITGAKRVASPDETAADRMVNERNYRNQTPVTPRIMDDLLPTDTDGVYEPEWFKRRQDRTITSIEQYALEYGWRNNEISPNYSLYDSGTILGTSSKPVGTPLIVDRVGQTAAQVYSAERNYDAAKAIWDDFRSLFREDAKRQLAMNLMAISNQRIAGGARPVGPSEQLSEQELNDAADAAINDFIKWCWQNPWQRGWIVKTADKKVGITGWGLENVARDLGGTAEDWTFERPMKAFGTWMNPATGNREEATLRWMSENQSWGKQQGQFLIRGAEEFKRGVIDGVIDAIKNVARAVGSVVTGVISLARLSLTTLTMGLNMATQMQQQTNALNRAMNDSIYYSFTPGSLLYYADNPFTREYGEPVIEVRQPFQRTHFLGSFQHIISNGIQETLDEVPTVVTASSNGKNPVTVYLDKGIPTERQRETYVETGLMWDKPGGFLSKLFNPIETLRGWSKAANGSSDETSSKRVALHHLKEGLKDIYGGELVVLGDATIRPYDLCYLSDIHSRMYGIFEVEQVVHHFTPETGFITSITPNAVVTVNDPARWSMISYLRSRWTIQNLRNDLRHILNVKAGTSGEIISMMPGGTANTFGATDRSIEDLAKTLETQIKGHLQYTGGITSVVKDLQASMMTGTLVGAGIGFGVAGVPGAVGGAALGAAGTWAAFDWVKDNLLDQHSAYISFLTHNGRPMNAGLNDNTGIAVGQMHSITLFKNSLRINVPISEGGRYRITNDELLTNLGWHAKDVEELSSEVDLFRNQINAKVLQMTQRNPDGVPLIGTDTVLVKVDRVIDGDTIVVSGISGATNLLSGRSGSTIRLSAIDSPEWAWKGSVQETRAFAPSDAGFLAYEYTNEQLLGKTVALRISPDNRSDIYGRTLAWVFHVVPEGTPDNAREEQLMNLASAWPQIEWDSYLPDGRPITYNWELVTQGYADVDMRSITVGIPSEAYGALALNPRTQQDPEADEGN